MPAEIRYSQEIDRPIAKVFHFMVTEHIRNHPRWDPDMKLEQVSDGPIGLGTVIRRLNNRSGTPVEGTMEVVEYELNQVMGVVIHDGPVEMRSRIIFEAISSSQTSVTIYIKFPDMDESMDKGPLMSTLERSGNIRKQLIESEV